MRSRFFGADYNHAMLSEKRDREIPSTPSGISVSTSSNSEGDYQSANDTLEMIWKDGRELKEVGAVKSENTGGEWTTSHTASIHSWTSSSPFNTGPAVFGMPTRASAIGNNAFTASPASTLGVPGDFFGQIGSWNRTLNIDRSAQSEGQTGQTVMDARPSPLSGTSRLAPLRFTAEELDHLAGRAGGIDVGDSRPSVKRISGAMAVTVGNAGQSKGLSQCPTTDSPMIVSMHQPSKTSVHNTVKAPSQRAPVPAGRQLSSSIHAAAAAEAANEKSNKDQGSRRKKPEMKNKGKEGFSGRKPWGEASGQEKDQRKGLGGQNDKGRGKVVVSYPPGPSKRETDRHVSSRDFPIPLETGPTTDTRPSICGIPHGTVINSTRRPRQIPGAGTLDPYKTIA